MISVLKFWSQVLAGNMHLRLPILHARLIIKVLEVVLFIVICAGYSNLRVSIVTPTLRVFSLASIVLAGVLAPPSLIYELYLNDPKRFISIKEIAATAFLCCIFMAPCVELLSFWLPSQLSMFGPSREQAFIFSGLCAASAALYALDALLAWPHRKHS
ncbi:uncharacterized protein LOC108673276 [Hyalella azteca]|uniref:Uncharacterized protein LOC108673276 n=1 Tax=Hyalella azteca TaxID=294128 RepID=A0A8B7NS85_HYAAZ|nr:uncharacterized protein LOC108673276 [Hyalella azteca]